MSRLTVNPGTRRALSRVDAKIAAAVADAPPLPDDLATLLVRLIRTTPSTREGGPQ